MLTQLQSFFAVMDEGSINRAALRLNISQPALSRQIQTLETEVGGELLERGAWGARPTDLGYRVSESMRPVVSAYLSAWEDIHTSVQGRNQTLRIGYIGSAASRYLTPALGELRKEHPNVKLVLQDQTPSEQLAALRKGQLDIALVGQEGSAVADEFYTQKLARLGVCALLPVDHALAEMENIHLADLKGNYFVGVSDELVPGRNQWTTKLCERAGFRPKFVAQTTEISHVFTLVAAENLISIVPDYFSGSCPPGVTIKNITDPWAHWDFLVMRQRGRGSTPGKRLIELLLNLES